MVFCPHCKTEIKKEEIKHETHEKDEYGNTIDLKRCPFCSWVLGIGEEDSTIKNHPKKIGKNDDWAFLVLSIAFFSFVVLIVFILMGM